MIRLVCNKFTLAAFWDGSHQRGARSFGGEAAAVIHCGVPETSQDRTRSSVDPPELMVLWL